VTPASLIRGIITEAGIVSPVTQDRIREIFADDACNAPEKR
jgi:methylthioribose-1-phosphate isomerase